VFVDEDSVGTGHHRAATSADRRMAFDDGVLDAVGERGLRALALELFSQATPFELDLGARVLRIVRIVEVHRPKRAVRCQ
jgi:hypothetical protein